MAYEFLRMRCILGPVGRRRWWLFVGALFLGAGLFVAATIFLPPSTSSVEPAWLASVSPDSRKSHRPLRVGPRSPDILVLQTRWSLKEPYDEVRVKLKDHFRNLGGFGSNVTSNSSMWRNLDMKSQEGLTLTVTRLDKETLVYLHTVRPIGWLDRIRFSVRKFFGASVE